MPPNRIRLCGGPTKTCRRAFASMVLAPLLLPLCSLEPGSLPASALSRLFNKAGAGANLADASWAPVTSTWDTAHTSVHTASKSALFREEEQGDAVGSEGKVAGAFGGFRSLEEASGDSSSGSGSGEEAGSGALDPSSPPPALPPPPSPSPSPSPPLAPGSANMVVNKTIITVTMTIAGTVEDFDAAAQTTFKNGLRADICNSTAATACPGVAIALTIAPGSVEVTSEISYREDDASVRASVQTKAKALENATTDSLSTLLGVTVESAPTVTVAKNVAVTVTVPAPSPPPPSPDAPSPSLPPPASPAKAADDGGTPTWLIAVIAVAAVLLLLLLGLFVNKRMNRNKAAGDVGTEMAKKGEFPLAIGASTTQHV